MYDEDLQTCEAGTPISVATPKTITLQSTLQAGRVTGPLRTYLGPLICRMGMMGNSPKLIHVQAVPMAALFTGARRRERVKV